MRAPSDAAAVDRLRSLLRERLAPGADRGTVDRRIWEAFGTELCVLMTDLAGFSRGVAEHGIIHYLQILEESARVLVPVIEQHGGELLKVEADSLMATFSHPRQAIAAAIAMQGAADGYNAAGRPAAEQLRICIGIGWGTVLRLGDGGDVFGVEVNAACILGEDTAKGGEVLATAAVREAAGDLPGISFEAMDRHPPGTSGAFRIRY
jgi:adenylate cyclase